MNTNSVPKLPLEAAAAKLYSMGIRTSTDFIDLCHGRFKNLTRPADIPSNPLAYYDGVNNFGDFLLSGVESIERGNYKAEESKVMTYTKLKELLRKHNISTVRQWKEAVKSDSLPGLFPRSPDIYYGDEFEGWPKFLAPKQERFLPFDEALKVARKLAKTYNLTTSYEWRWLSRSGHRPKNLPALPSSHYAGSWQSWQHWYGLTD